MTYGDIYICTETNALTIVTPIVKSGPPQCSGRGRTGFDKIRGPIWPDPPDRQQEQPDIGISVRPMKKNRRTTTTVCLRLQLMLSKIKLILPKLTSAGLPPF